MQRMRCIDVVHHAPVVVQQHVLALAHGLVLVHVDDAHGQVIGLMNQSNHLSMHQS